MKNIKTKPNENKLKNFAKDSLFYGIGDTLGKLTNLILLPIISRIFLPAEYGIIDLLIVTYNFILMALSLNVLTGFQKYYYTSQGESRKELMTSISVFFFLFYVLIGIVLFCLSKYLSFSYFQSDICIKPIMLLALCLPIEALFNFLTLTQRLKKQPIQFSIVNIIRVITTVLVTYICVINLRTGIIGVFIAKFSVLLILTGSLLFVLRAEFSRKICFQTYKNTCLFSLPGHPAIFIKSLMNILPIIILNYFSTLTMVGLFGIANRIAQSLNLFVNAFQKAWNPFAFEHANKPEEAYLYSKVYKMFTAGFILLGLTFTLFAKELVGLLTPVEYHYSYKLVGGLCLFYGARGISLIYSTVFYAKNKVIYTSYLTIVNLVVFLFVSYFLVKRYEAMGLIFALNFSLLVNLLLYHFLTMKIFKFKVELHKLFIAVLTASFGVMLLNRLQLSLFFTLFIKSIFLIAFTFFVVLLFTNKKERAVLRETINSKLRLLKSTLS